MVEVMIVVAIVAILAAIAIPSYNDYVRRGQIPEAFTYLSDYRTKMEQYYQDNRNYGTAAKCAADATADSWSAFTPSNAKYFSYACETSNSTQGFKVTATGAAGRALGHTYTIDHLGNRATKTFKGAVVTQNCWLTTSTTC